MFCACPTPLDSRLESGDRLIRSRQELPWERKQPPFTVEFELNRLVIHSDPYPWSGVRQYSLCYPKGLQTPGFMIRAIRTCPESGTPSKAVSRVTRSFSRSMGNRALRSTLEVSAFICVARRSILSMSLWVTS